MVKKFVLVLLSILILIPVLLLIVQSLSKRWNYGHLLPKEWSLRAWDVLLSEQRLTEAIGWSYLIGILVIILNIFIGVLAGKALAHENFKGKSMIETMLILPIIIPSLAVAMGVHFTMIRWGIADHWLGVVVVHLIPTVPYSIKMFRNAFDQIGLKQEEQANSLGASKLYIFYSIYFPQLIQTIRAVVFLIFVISLSQYALTAIIGGGNVLTLAMIYFPYFSTVDDAVMSSFSLLFATLPVILFLLCEFVLRLMNPYKRKFR